MRRHSDFPGKVSELTPAPGDLKIVQAFVNTADLQLGTDLTTDPRAFGAWLERFGLAVAGIRLQPAELARAKAVREALRAQLWASTRGGELSARDVATLDGEAAKAPVRVRFSEDGEPRLAGGPASPSAGSFEAALGRLFAIVATARFDGSWKRLKVCANPGCRAAFWDAATNRSGRWCDMRRCGNRIKSKTHRRRWNERFAG